VPSDKALQRFFSKYDGGVVEFDDITEDEKAQAWAI